MRETARIKIFPASVLRHKAARVMRFDAKLRRLADLMVKTMKSQPDGIGIAAPQIGVRKQVAIVDVSPRIPGRQRLVLVNPRVLAASGPRSSREGCMSLPDYTAVINRFENIRLGWQSVEGDYHEADFEGLEAVCIQHEADHLGGILFIDRVISLKRDLIPRPRAFKAK